MNLENTILPFLRSGKHSETLEINQISHNRTQKNLTTYRFGFGQSPFPVPNEITRTLIDAAHRKEYMPVQGHEPLRKAIARFHNRVENKKWNAEQVIVGAGSKILLYCVMAALKQAEVVLPAPSWVSYEPQGGLAGHKVNWINTSFEDEWKLSAGALEAYCSSRADKTAPLLLIFNYPSNPTGQTYNSRELEALAAVMRRHNIIVIADEIYSLLSFESSYSTLEEFYPEGCIVSSGLSKWCGAGGWRIGFHHIPKSLGDEFFKAVISVASETYSCAPAPMQIAATKAYEDISLANSVREKQTRILEKIASYCCEKLSQTELLILPSQGGFYLFPDFEKYREKLHLKGIRTSTELTSTLLSETGIALLPGSAFGMEKTSLTTRLAFVDFDGEKALTAKESELEFDKLKEGIVNLCRWLEKL